MIIFDNEAKIKWERHNSIENEINKKTLKIQFLTNQMFKDRIEKK